MAASDTLRQRLRTRWLDRLPRADSLELHHGNVYILPTRGGWLFALTLLVMLAASVNYQLNLGYALTFLLAGSGAASMLATHRTLQGLNLSLRPPVPGFAGEPARLDVALRNPTPRERFGIGLRLGDAADAGWTWLDLAAGGHAQAQLTFVPAARGRHALPTITVETRFPLGLFRAWALWRPAAEVLAWPRLETAAPPLPPVQAAREDRQAARRSQGSELEGVRPWRRGDPVRAVVWKRSARALAAGGEPVVRDTSAPAAQALWLDWQATAGPGPEGRLERLASWIVRAEDAGLPWGLRLPGIELAPALGPGHRVQGLERLALWSPGAAP